MGGVDHVSVVPKRLCAAAKETAAETANKGDDNNPLGPTGRGVKTIQN